MMALACKSVGGEKAAADYSGRVLFVCRVFPKLVHFGLGMPPTHLDSRFRGNHHGLVKATSRGMKIYFHGNPPCLLPPAPQSMKMYPHRLVNEFVCHWCHEPEG